VSASVVSNLKSPKNGFLPVPLRLWIRAEAKRLHICAHTVWTRKQRGKYPNFKFIKINARRVDVLLPDDEAAVLLAQRRAERAKKCECGRPAEPKKVSGHYVCVRCREIENRLYNGNFRQAVPAADPMFWALTKYAERFSFAGSGRRTPVHI
jgi:hypothetical protein